MKIIFKRKDSFLLIVTTFLMVIGCSSSGSKKSGVDSTLNKSKTIIEPITGFREFIDGFKQLPYPVSIRTLDIDPASYRKFTKADNVFIKSAYPDEIYSYGILPDTADSYKIVWLSPAESLIPILTTFTKSGKKIKEEELGVGGCGSDCGFTCNEWVTINKDLEIFSVDSIKSSQCDNNGIKLNTEKRYIRYKEGKILKNGEITMSKVVKKNFN
jgi:hypothetical protein